MIKTIEDEKKSMNNIGSYKTNMFEIIQEINQVLTQETNLELERNNCMLINNIGLHEKYNIKVIQPIESLCDSKHFVYQFEPGIPILEILNLDLDNLKKHQIITNLVLYFYDLLHNYNILLGDLNSGNILYNQELDKIIIIDFGCIIKLSEDKKNYFKD